MPSTCLPGIVIANDPSASVIAAGFARAEGIGTDLDSPTGLPASSTTIPRTMRLPG